MSVVMSANGISHNLWENVGILFKLVKYATGNMNCQIIPKIRHSLWVENNNQIFAPVFAMEVSKSIAACLIKNVIIYALRNSFKPWSKPTLVLFKNIQTEENLIRPISYVESWNAIQTIDNENTYSSRRRRMTEWILMLPVGVFSLDESYTILKCFLWISKIMHDCQLVCASWLANMAYNVALERQIFRYKCRGKVCRNESDKTVFTFKDYKTFNLPESAGKREISGS
jgi:hypothetical protein